MKSLHSTLFYSQFFISLLHAVVHNLSVFGNATTRDKLTQFSHWNCNRISLLMIWMTSAYFSYYDSLTNLFLSGFHPPPLPPWLPPSALAFPCGFRQHQEKKFFLYNIFRPIGKWAPSFFTNLKLQPSGKMKINLVKWLWMIVGPNSTENIFKQKYPVHEKSILMPIMVLLNESWE